MGNLFSSPPKPKPQPAPTVDAGAIAKGLLPGAKADAAARMGGGISPNFLANVLSEQTGAPGAGMSVLDDIRKSLGPDTNG